MCVGGGGWGLGWGGILLSKESMRSRIGLGGGSIRHTGPLPRDPTPPLSSPRRDQWIRDNGHGTNGTGTNMPGTNGPRTKDPGAGGGADPWEMDRYDGSTGKPEVRVSGLKWNE